MYFLKSSFCDVPMDVPKKGSEVKFSTMVEVCAAMHLSSEIASEFKQRGGIIFVAPPGHLKTSAIETVELFPHARVISNLTVKALNTMRQDFLSGQLKTMAFSDLENIYRRHGSVASQIEGVLMGLVEEGFRNPAFSDQRTSVMPARCAVIGGIATKVYEERISAWLDSGFARRFLLSKYTAHESVIKKLEESIIAWKKTALVNGFNMRIPVNPISVDINEKDSEKVLWQLRFQYDRRTPFVIAKKIIGVLVWKFKDKKKAWEIWDDFAPSLDKDGTTVTI
jgi:hypothetical protein